MQTHTQLAVCPEEGSICIGYTERRSRVVFCILLLQSPVLSCVACFFQADTGLLIQDERVLKLGECHCPSLPCLITMISYGAGLNVQSIKPLSQHFTNSTSTCI